MNSDVQRDRKTNSEPERPQLKRPYKAGNSVAVTIAPQLVKKLDIDAETIFEEIAVENGILLRIRRLAR